MIKVTRYQCFLPVFFLFCLSANAQQNLPQTPFEKDSNTSATYEEVIQYYEQLDAAFSELMLYTFGETDSGKPLHVAVVSKGGLFDTESIRKSGRLVVFVNNGIHPGEPCGIDASMQFVRDCLQKKDMNLLLDRIVLVVVPVYNIGGALNRNSHSRANQDGPLAYGFRGNAKNLDLNRDFIKCDSKNAQSFNQLFASFQPDVFLDTHTSNGADYQHTMTLIATQHNKLEPALATYQQETFVPALYSAMKLANWDLVPYVYARDTPENGIYGFLDLPRYGSGYAALHNCLSFISETHMLKPFEDRVKSTYDLMQSLLRLCFQEYSTIKVIREKATANSQSKRSFDLNWELEPEKVDSITFKGYEASYKTSAVSFLDRLFYDHNRPFTRQIPFFNYYKVSLSVEKPVAYIIPQAYTEVAQRLAWNGVKMQQLTEDIEVDVAMYYIRNFESTPGPYEGHFLHSKVEVEKVVRKQRYHKGDLVVFVNQAVNRYIVETLEPQAPDSYFAWNFFDGILMQKEYFSSYVFEDLAADYLKAHPELREQLEEKRKTDEEFANSARAQLDFVYKNSPYYEPTHQLYPVGRLEGEVALPLSKN